MNIEQFTTQIDMLITGKAAELIKNKPEDQQYLSWLDMQTITNSVKVVFSNKFGEIPQNVEIACSFAEAVIAPNRTQKIDIIKKIVSLATTGTGISLILAGVGSALGWGAGVVTTISAFFIGASLMGPMAAITGGAVLVAIAGYFAFNSDSVTLSNKAIETLKRGLHGAIAAYWQETGETLTEEKNSDVSSSNDE